jgi:hypothetical protein
MGVIETSFPLTVRLCSAPIQTVRAPQSGHGSLRLTAECARLAIQTINMIVITKCKMCLAMFAPPQQTSKRHRTELALEKS